MISPSRQGRRGARRAGGGAALPVAGPLTEASRLQGQVAAPQAEPAAARRPLAVQQAVAGFRDAVLRRHGGWSYPPGNAAVLDAQDFVPFADGFYEIEHAPDGTAYRWTGPDHFSRWRVFVDRRGIGTLRVSVWSLGQIADPCALSVDIDGCRYPLRPDPHDGSVLTAAAISPRRDDMLDIFLHVPVVFSPKSLGIKDERMLGIAVRRLTFLSEDPAGGNIRQQVRPGQPRAGRAGL